MRPVKRTSANGVFFTHPIVVFPLYAGGYSASRGAVRLLKAKLIA